jgi:uncharacterized protein YcgI (DUF1989 family)
MSKLSEGLIPARKGVAVAVREGQHIRVVNTHGQQVVDTWAFCRPDSNEFMSMEHTRAGLRQLMPRIGDMMLTNKRRPILKLVEDTSGGVHDTLIAACDIYRYQGLGAKGHHDNCTENLAAALATIAVAAPETPCPLNLFMNIPWTADGQLIFKGPVCKAGDYVTFLAHMDCTVVFSACPQDMLPTNGVDCIPTDARFEVLT